MGATFDGTAGESKTRGLAEQSSRVIEDIRDLGQMAAANAGQRVQELRAQGAEAIKAGKQKAGELTESLEEKLFDNPWKTVLIAAGVGALLGFAVRRWR